jgi:hypothetical protein
MKKKNLFSRVFHSRLGSFIFFALATLAFFMLRSAKWAYDWIAELYPLRDKFIPTLFVLISISAIVTFIFLLDSKKLKDSRAMRTLHAVFSMVNDILPPCCVQCLIVRHHIV